MHDNKRTFFEFNNNFDTHKRILVLFREMKERAAFDIQSTIDEECVIYFIADRKGCEAQRNKKTIKNVTLLRRK